MGNQAVLTKLLIMAVAALVMTLACMFWTYHEQHTILSKRFIALTIMFCLILILIYFL